MFDEIKNPTTKGIFINSLAMRLGVRVFRSYLIIAFLLTAFQLGVEYNAARQRVFNDLQSISNSFKESLTKALWSMDGELINSEASGMISAPSVTGLKIIDEDNNILVHLGDAFTGNENTFSNHISIELIKSDTTKGPFRLGFLKLYANPSISINQLKASSIAIIINSLLRAIFLWLLFKWIFERNLLKPLSELTQLIGKLETATNNTITSYEPIIYNYKDELGLLIDTTNALQSNLITARQEREVLLRDLHDGLGAQIITARLRMSEGRLSISEADSLLSDCMDELYAIIDAMSDPDSNLEEALTNFKFRCLKKAPSIEFKLSFLYPYGTLPPSNPRTVIQIIRILQESFTNTLKHANASSVYITVDFNDSLIIIESEDNGHGIPNNFIQGRGLNNMQRRAREIGSNLSVSRTNKGTCVRLEIPLVNVTSEKI